MEESVDDGAVAVAIEQRQRVTLVSPGVVEGVVSDQANILHMGLHLGAEVLELRLESNQRLGIGGGTIEDLLEQLVKGLTLGPGGELAELPHRSVEAEVGGALPDDQEHDGDGQADFGAGHLRDYLISSEPPTISAIITAAVTSTLRRSEEKYGTRASMSMAAPAAAPTGALRGPLIPEA